MSDEDCSDDYLEISDIRARDDDGNDVDSRRICGTTSPMEVASQGSSLRIHLVSDGVGSGRGWSGVFTNVLPAGKFPLDTETGLRQREKGSGCVYALAYVIQECNWHFERGRPKIMI